MIAIASDHAGYELKEAIKKHLEGRNIEYKDFGTYCEESVDYPVFAYKAATAVTKGECEKAILCCGTGIGIGMAANKIKGIRAAMCSDEFSAEMTRRHNDANAICLGGRVITAEKAIKLTDIFLDTEFEGGKHLRRVNMITDIENGKNIAE